MALSSKSHFWFAFVFSICDCIKQTEKRRMPDIQTLHESPFTWQLVHYHIEKHIAKKPFTTNMKMPLKSIRSNEMLLSPNQLKNFIQIRDWLYDTENFHGEWTMFGLFLRSTPISKRKPRTDFEGVSFSFDNIISAAHFRLRWDAHCL